MELENQVGESIIPIMFYPLADLVFTELMPVSPLAALKVIKLKILKCCKSDMNIQKYIGIWE